MKPESPEWFQRKRVISRLLKIILLALGLLVTFSLTVFFISRTPHGLYWGSKKYSFGLELLGTNNPYDDQGFLVHNGWDGPTGYFTHWKLYGVKLGKALIDVQVLDDPIAAIKRNLPEDVPGLMESVSSKDYLIKKCAGEALIQLGPAAAEVLPELLRRFQQGDEQLDGIIIELSKTAGRNAVPWLIKLLAEQEPKIREKAAEALGEIGPDAFAAVTNLTKTLADRDGLVVITSALSLHKIEKQNHGEVAALLSLLDNQDPRIRGSAIFNMGEFGEDAASTVGPLINILEENNPATSGMAARTLGLIGPAARPAIPKLVKLLDSQYQQVLMFAMEALGRFGEDAKASIPKLVELADREDQMWGAISALSSMGTDAVPSLISFYQNGTNGQISLAARAIKKLGPKAADAVPALMEALNSENKGRITMAAIVLGCLGDKAKVAVPKLKELTLEENPVIRVRAAEALWKLDRQTNLVVSVMILELRNWSKDPEALRSMMGDSESHSRQEVAAEILGEIGPAARDAVPLLQYLQRSSFDSQRGAAKNALDKIMQNGH